MSRKPLPADSKKYAFELWKSHGPHLKTRMEETGKDFSHVLNTELEYARRFDLLPQYERRLTVDAKTRGITLRDEVKKLLHEEAFRLPTTRVKPVAASPIQSERVSVNLTGTNHSHLTHLSDVTEMSMVTALNTELLFAQTYELNRELLARLETTAADEQVPLRALVTDLLNQKAIALRREPASGQKAPVRAAR